MAKRLYLRKSNDDFVSHCKCVKADALIVAPCQADCPWCGCGWLFSCIRCRKAFTFAEVVETSESWKSIAERDFRGRFDCEPEPEDIAEWIEGMKILLKGIRRGQKYVYLDGWIIPTNADGVNIEGWHSRHDLGFVPQVAALEDRKVRTGLLSLRKYWLSTALKRDSD